MSTAIQGAASSLLADLERLRSIGNNMANASTPGYRAERLVNQSFAILMIAALLSSPRMDVVADSRPGSIRATGRTLDLALDGPGYFQIAGPSGVVYTRRGDFRRDDAGRLATTNGLAVLGAAGEVFLTAAEVQVERNGTISQDGTKVGRLLLTEFEASEKLRYLGDGLYQSSSEGTSSSTTSLLQRHLEMSNVDIVAESLRMLEINRHVGMVGQVLRGYDQMLDSAINNLGRS